jgi:hypothetical protein
MSAKPLATAVPIAASMFSVGERVPISCASEQFRREAQELLAAAQSAIDEAALLMLIADELDMESGRSSGQGHQPN